MLKGWEGARVILTFMSSQKADKSQKTWATVEGQKGYILLELKADFFSVSGFCVFCLFWSSEAISIWKHTEYCENWHRNYSVVTQYAFGAIKNSCSLWCLWKAFKIICCVIIKTFCGHGTVKELEISLVLSR